MLSPANLTLTFFSSSMLSSLVNQINLSLTSTNNSPMRPRQSNHICLLVLLLLHYSPLCSTSPAASTTGSTSEDILTNNIGGTNDNQILTYLTHRGHHGPPHHHPNLCPKWLNCTENYFDEGKDCGQVVESAVSAAAASGPAGAAGGSRGRCNCIAHCCMAFDCRDWGILVQCRRKCGVTPNRFGLRRTEGGIDCEKYYCERAYFDPAWDVRGATTGTQRNCIGHCCYALDCRRTLGYCRHACGVDAWVTARPLG